MLQEVVGRQQQQEALSDLTQYYRNNSLRASPDEAQVIAFHLRNKEVNRLLKIE